MAIFHGVFVWLLVLGAPPWNILFGDAPWNTDTGFAFNFIEQMTTTG